MKRYLVEPGSKVDLSKWDTLGEEGFPNKAEGQVELEKQAVRLDELQELLFAEHKHKLLVVLQGMDTSGKDGVIRHVFSRVSPQGVHVASFKVPTPEEVDHDYLWRVHMHVPGRGEIGIFNRSHYEDVLVTLVHGAIDEKEVKTRYRQINEFERMLTEEGTTILKVFLHLSKNEQGRRIKARMDDPHKHWKLSLSDLRERTRWDDYQKAFEQLFENTSTDFAPWYIVPADKKWRRNLAIAGLIIKTLDAFDMKYPATSVDISGARAA
jgi:PPK2 family polyphosphate:nucleotide phosphotransferase